MRMPWDGTFTPWGNESFSFSSEGVEEKEGIKMQKVRVEFVKPNMKEGEKFFQAYVLPILERWVEKGIEVEVEIENGKKKVGILKEVDKEKILLEGEERIRIEEIRVISRWEAISSSMSVY
ncbi:hypothetical protein J7J39_02920 [bacterium]|nr:hypothetical protein [bacterium]